MRTGPFSLLLLGRVLLARLLLLELVAGLRTLVPHSWLLLLGCVLIAEVGGFEGLLGLAFGLAHHLMFELALLVLFVVVDVAGLEERLLRVGPNGRGGLAARRERHLPGLGRVLERFVDDDARRALVEAH